MTSASVIVSKMGDYTAPTHCVEMCIVGGGISGLLAAQQALQRDIPYQLVDREEDLGGIWSTMSNNYSYLQARCGGRAARRGLGHSASNPC